MDNNPWSDLFLLKMIFFLFVQIQKIPSGGILVINVFNSGPHRPTSGPQRSTGPKGPNCFSRGFIQVFLRKPLATCDVLGDGLDQVPTSGSVHCPWKHLFGCIVHGNIYLGALSMETFIWVHCPWKHLFGCIVHGNIYLGALSMETFICT